ncbi:MAG: NAD(P)/FAD-dependent oxidoreductase [Bacteroidales bacterium]|nr:NAD(P)/FAD-dependent oxidoreductase [Bacteroidales bacterium]
MKEFEITCPLTREPRLKEIEAKAAGMKWVLRKRSIDARKEPVWRYQYEAYGPGEEPDTYVQAPYQDVHDAPAVIVVGAGPAGMFAALKLLTLGLKPIVLERGKDVHERKFDMARLSREGVVNPESNYCYGEGGAGAFSDGKLYTRSSKRGDNREVLHQLVAFGASKDILIDAHPHIGSDKLPTVVENIRRCIIEHGGEYYFGAKVVSINYQDSTASLSGSGRQLPLNGVSTPGHGQGEGPVDSKLSRSGDVDGDGRGRSEAESAQGQTAAASDRMQPDGDPRELGEAEQISVKTADGREFRGCSVILATGHSARDVYEMLDANGVPLEAKGFALGVRVEHPQEKINFHQYHGTWKPGVPAAEYSFVEQVDGRGVFSFCMCPGGILVPSSTEPGTVVLNGMSNSARNGKFANAGVVVQIEPEDVKGDSPFRLLDFQREVEKTMFDYCEQRRCSGEKDLSQNPMAAPAQRMEDFCLGRLSKKMPPTSYNPGVISAPLHELLPPIVAQRLQKAFPRVKMKGYYTNAALLLGVESRTSSPVRIPRDPETMEAIGLPGVYPAGEGAGYSGGIVSSAIDGIRCAAAAAAAVSGLPISDSSER